MALITRLYLSIFLFAAVIVAASGARADFVLTVAADANIYGRYTQFLSGNEQRVDNITDLGQSIANRPVAELVYMQQALRAGGLDFRLQFVDSPNAARDVKLVESGKALIAGHTVFSCDISDRVYRTRTIIPANAFAKGVYTTPDNESLLLCKKLEELRYFSAVSSSTWTADWKTLKQMKMEKVFSAPTYETMIRMLANGRGDFVLLEFPSGDDLSVELFGITLVPVPGIKVGIKGSRHFVVSKVHPDGKSFAALERGLNILEKQQRIERYLREVGFYNQKVEGWTLVNP